MCVCKERIKKGSFFLWLYLCENRYRYTLRGMDDGVCVICCEAFGKVRRRVSCPCAGHGGGGDGCGTCYRRYFRERGASELGCMVCSGPWDRTIVSRVFPEYARWMGCAIPEEEELGLVEETTTLGWMQRVLDEIKGYSAGPLATGILEGATASLREAFAGLGDYVGDVENSVRQLMRFGEMFVTDGRIREGLRRFWTSVYRKHGEMEMPSAGSTRYASTFLGLAEDDAFYLVVRKGSVLSWRRAWRDTGRCRGWCLGTTTGSGRWRRGGRGRRGRCWST